jgi:hypothetical protein
MKAAKTRASRLTRPYAMRPQNHDTSDAAGHSCETAVQSLDHFKLRGIASSWEYGSTASGTGHRLWASPGRSPATAVAISASSTPGTFSVIAGTGSDAVLAASAASVEESSPPLRSVVSRYAAVFRLLTDWTSAARSASPAWSSSELGAGSVVRRRVSICPEREARSTHPGRTARTPCHGEPVHHTSDAFGTNNRAANHTRSTERPMSRARLPACELITTCPSGAQAWNTTC